MNILIITTRLNLGGVGVYTTSLAKGLKRRGHKVIVASSGGALKNILNTEGITHIHIPIDTSTEIGPHVMIAAMKLFKILRTEKIEIVHAQTRVAQVIAHYLTKFSKAVFVTTCHGFFRRRLIRRLLPCWGDRVIAISDAVREHLVNIMRVPKDRIELIYNGIDTEPFSKRHTEPEREEIRRQFNLSKAPVIGITARISNVKGHIYLLKAMVRIKRVYPDAQLFIVGSGKKRFEKKVHSMCKKLNLQDNVVFSPGVRDVSKPLSVMDVFVLPSIQEGLGLSLLEAMYMGLPVVASNVGGIYSVVKDQESGLLVPPKDDEALARAIISLLKNLDLAQKLGKKGKAFVKENFMLDGMLDKVEGFYARTLTRE